MSAIHTSHDRELSADDYELAMLGSLVVFVILGVCLALALDAHRPVAASLAGAADMVALVAAIYAWFHIGTARRVPRL